MNHDSTSRPDPDPATKKSSETFHATDDERIDEAIAESFPASDPPSYNAGRDRDEEE